MTQFLTIRRITTTVLFSLFSGTIVLVPQFASSVSAAPALSPATQTVVASIGGVITPTAAFMVTEITGTKTFGITPALPAGLTMNSTTGVVSGAPSVSLANTTFTIVVSDGSVSALATLSLTVNELTAQQVAVAPTSQAVSGKIGTAMIATSAISAPLITGIKYFSISPKLPNGLTMNSATGVVSGTPVGTASQLIYIIAVSDGVKYGISTLRIAISGPFALSPSTQTVTGQVGKAIVETALLTSTSLAATRTYSISPKLPSGLVLHATKGIVYGTPLVGLASTTFTVTATVGSQTAISTISISIVGAIGAIPQAGNRAGCGAATIGGRLVQSIKPTDAELPSTNFACAVNVGVRARGITVAMATAGVVTNPDVRQYLTTASRVNGGSITKNLVVSSKAGVQRSQFTNLRRGTWFITVRATSATGVLVGTWTSSQFRIG